MGDVLDICHSGIDDGAIETMNNYRKFHGDPLNSSNQVIDAANTLTSINTSSAARLQPSAWTCYVLERARERQLVNVTRV